VAVAAGTRAGGLSLQERFERSRPGRILISLFVIVTLVTVVTANLPASRLQDVLLKPDHPYLYGLGLDQAWGVFAPDPRQATVDLIARVTYADGSQATWQVPRRNNVVGEYLDYRWLKWAEWTVQPAYSNLDRPTAIYAARRLATQGHQPVRVTLVDRSHPISPPGQIPDVEPVGDRTFYTTPITPAMLQGTSG
jgi:hypothetical protein